MKEDICTQVPRRQATQGSTRVSQKAEGGKGQCGPNPLLGFLQEGMGDAGQVCCVSLGSDILNNFSKLQPIRVVSTCLTHGSAELGQGELWLGV